MNPWTKQFSKTIDQRNQSLPPSWKSLTASANQVAELVGGGVYRSGKSRQLASRVQSIIRGAREMVVASSFLLADAEVERSLLDAARRGVRVYLLLATETRLTREPSDDDSEFDRKVLADHLAMLKRLAGWTLIRSAPEFHAKVVLADPTSRGTGVLLTANLTTEALERNEEMGLDLSAEEAREVFGYLRWAAWEGASHELMEPGQLRSVKPFDAVDVPEVGEMVVATAGAQTSIREEILRVVDSAEEELVVSSFGWELKHPVVQRLLQRSREGLRLIILCRMRPASMPALLALAEAGASVLGFRWLHAKAVWSDTGEAVVMSANLEAQGLDRGFELGLTLTDRRAEAIERLLRSWTDSAPWQLLPKPKLGDLIGKACVWRDWKFVEIDVAPERPCDLGSVCAASAHDLQAPSPGLPRDGGLPLPAHSVNCVWTVTAPRLTQAAKEIFQCPEPDLPDEEDDGVPAKKGKKHKKAEKSRSVSYHPRAFWEPSGRVVVAVETADELPAAGALAEELGAKAIVVAGGVSHV
jgi:cardiolipin synthase